MKNVSLDPCDRLHSGHLMYEEKTLTISLELHATKHERSHKLHTNVPSTVHKYGGKVLVRIIGDARGGDCLHKLRGRKLPRKLREVLIDEGAQRDPRSQVR